MKSVRHATGSSQHAGQPISWKRLGSRPAAAAKWWVSVTQVTVAILAILVLVAGPATAESLREALAAAYRDNPTLAAERAALRATDENVSQALAGYRPSLSASVDASSSDNENNLPLIGASSYSSKPRGYSITLSQPLFQGFRVVNNVRQAESLVESGREVLRNQEQNTLYEAVNAFMDVLRDQAILDLQRNNVAVLGEQLRATTDRFEVGEVTRTDVAQSQAALAGAQSAQSLASANLETSRAVYQQIIGHVATRLSWPPSVARMLPNSLEQAMAIAETSHPAISSARHVEAAARHQTNVIKGELYPTVSLEGSYSKRWEVSPSISRNESASVTGRVTVPIYQRGAVSSRIRQSRDTEFQRLVQVQEARAQVRAAVVSAWGQYSAARAQIVSDEIQVRANKVALQGVREETRVGQRTVLDELDAEQDLLNARVNLVRTRRDQVVAGYALLSAVGGLSARQLALPVKLYDPSLHYRKVRNKWFGTGVPGLD